MPEGSSLPQKVNAVLEKPAGMIQSVVNFFMRDGSLAGLAREGVKDIQSTFHEAMWGQSGPSGEPGAPLTPLHSDIEDARNHYSPSENTPMSLPSPSQIGKSSAAVHTSASEPGKAMPSPSHIAKGTVPGKGDTQYAQEFVMPEGMPMPEPMPEAAPMPEPAAAPEAAPAGEGTATQGQAPRGSGMLERLEARRGFKGGNSDEGISRTEWLDQQREARQGGGGAQEQGRSLADEQKERTGPDGPSRGGRGR